MIVVNMLGGPGSGKSTLAAELFVNIKQQGQLKVELVTEYVKGAVYGENITAIKDQFYLTAKHAHNLNKLRDKVDIVITDCSLLNAAIYKDFYEEGSWEAYNAQAAASAAWTLTRSFDNYFIIVERNKPYADYGRTQSESEAISIDAAFKTLSYNLTAPVYIHKGQTSNTLDSLLAYVEIAKQ